MAQASAEKLEHTGPAEKERVASVPQSEQLASTPEPPFPKEKETEPSDRKVEESEGEREPHLGGKRGIRGKHGEERVNSSVKQSRYQKGEAGQARRASLGEVEGNMSG